MVRAPVIFASFLLTLLGVMLLGYNEQVWLYFFVQALLLFSVVRQKTISSLGAFLLLSLLMFGLRPLYIIVEEDYELLDWLRVDRNHPKAIGYAMFLATLCACTVSSGYLVSLRLKSIKPKPRATNSGLQKRYPMPTGNCVLLLLGIQVVSLLFIYSLRGGQVTALYASSGGAYVYLFPQVLQSLQILIVVIFVFSKHINKRGSQKLVWVSIAMFLLFTYFMKDVSMFRGFYITGAIGAFLAVVHARNGKVPYWILVLPIVFFLPFFRALGASRNTNADTAFTYALGVLGGLSPQRWWEFFNSKGDMNIFDTFVAAIESTPVQMPYFFAWVYSLLHWIPRSVWPGKPANGMLVDMSFTKGAPFHPGLIGFYFLDGGTLWMLASCFLTGVLLCFIDITVFSLRDGFLKSALYGIVIINGMYFARGYLHFQIMQYAYTILPLVLFYNVLRQLKLLRQARLRQPEVSITTNPNKFASDSL